MVINKKWQISFQFCFQVASHFSRSLIFFLELATNYSLRFINGSRNSGIFSGFWRPFLPPAKEVCEGYVFTGVCLSTGAEACIVVGGTCVVAGGRDMCGCRGRGMCGCWGEGHVWLVGGGMHGCWEGMCGCWGNMHGCWGACMDAGRACVVAGGTCVAAGGHAWLQGACVVGGWACVVAGGAWMVAGGWHVWLPGGVCIGYDEIRSMSGRSASSWNAFLFHE